MNLSKLENKIGSALLAKAEATKVAAAKDQYDTLDSIDKQILSLCNTPATDSRIKQFFTARDAENKTLNIDHKIQTLMRQGFLGRGANKYVLNPEFREFITVMPMTASVAKVAEGLTEDVLSTPSMDPEVVDEIRELVITNDATLEVIAEEISAKYNLDEGDVYTVAQMIERTGKKEAADDYDELTKDVLVDEGLSGDVIDEVRELVTAQDLTLEVIAEEIAAKYNLDESDVYAAAQKIERTGSVKKSFSLKKKPKVAFDKKDLFRELDKHEWGSILQAQEALADKFDVADDEFTALYKEWLDQPKQATDIGLGMGIVDRTEREEMRESLIGAEEGETDYDDQAANDLIFFMDNERHFHETHYMPAVTSIVNFIHSGEATEELLLDIAKDVVREGVKEYNRSDAWDNFDFNEATINAVAMEYVRLIKIEDELGNYDSLLDTPPSDKEKTSMKRRLANKKAAASLGGSTSYTFNKHTLPNQAVRFARKFLSNYTFPIAPDISYTAVKNASTDDNNCTVDGDALITVNFRTLSGVKKAADIVIPIRNGELLEPATIQVDGRSYIVSQSAIDSIIKSATFYNKPIIGDVFSNPLDRNTNKKIEKSKLPTFNRGMFSI